MGRRLGVLFLVWSALAMGAGEAGNGGDVVICRVAGSVSSVKVLDFHEAQVMRPELIHSLGSGSLSALEKVEYALSRMERLDPDRSAVYQEKARVFFDNVRFVNGVNLQDISDSGYVPIPSHCKVEQIAIQKKPLFPEDRLYTINRDLWDLLDADNQAGLILHEVVYGELIFLGHKNSIKARYFASLISSAVMDSLSLREYRERLKIVVGDVGPLPGKLEFSDHVYGFQVKAGDCLNLELTTLLKSKGSGDLEWAVLGAPVPWMVFSSKAGILQGCPTKADVGTSSISLTVRDANGENGGIARLNFNVVAQNVPPIWLENPIHLEGKVNEVFATSLGSKVKDPDGDGLTFQKVSGPGWLVVNSAGTLLGTPDRPNVGINQFVVRAIDSAGLSSDVIVEINIK